MNSTTTGADRDERANRIGSVTDEVLASFEGTPSPRTRRILEALVSHLHAFALEVKLTEQEWHRGIEFLKRCGDITDDRRHEFILLSDVLGLSMLTIGINAPDDPAATEPTVFGPFFVEGSPELGFGDDVGENVSGEPCWVEGHVTDVAGRPLAGAKVEVWQADADGFYDVQYDDGRLAGRAHMQTDEQGRYGFWTVKPAPYPIPDDGPVGDLLKAARRGPMRPAHIHFMVSAEGHHTLVTHVFVAGDPYLSSDAVFGVKDSLILDFAEQPPGPAPADRDMPSRWWQLNFDVRVVTTPQR